MSKADTWMPFYIGDYLADTMHLSTAEHGAYMLLLMQYWRNGPLPDNDGDLARMACTPPDEWAAIGPRIRAFFKAKGGRLHQKRSDIERKRAENNRKKRAKSGSKGGKAKAEKAKQKQLDTSKSQEFARDLLENSQTPSPSPLPSKEESKVPTTSGAEAAPRGVGGTDFVPPPDARLALFGTGLASLQALTGQTPKAARSLMGRLLADGGDDAAMVHEAIRQAEANRPTDPTAWLMAAIRPRKPLNGSPQRRPSADAGRRESLIEAGLLAPDEQPLTIDGNLA